MSIIPEYGFFCPVHGWKGWLGKFCSDCGVELENRPLPMCSECGGGVNVGPFCSHCGTKLPKKATPA